MSETDKYRALIGQTLAAHVYELLQILADDKAYLLIVDNGSPQLSFHAATVSRVLRHVETAWNDIHENSKPKAAVLPFRPATLAERANIVEVK